MQELDDMALLREYAARGSEAAFATLVSRRVPFVYSAALRQVRDPHLAAEITQAVFIILAQKAGRLRDGTVLAGWLFKTTRFVAIAETRSLAKRRRHEQAMHMQAETFSPAPDPLWEQMSPLLDDALAQLGESDRHAVLLRFFENKSLAEVGLSLGAGEDTARKRVSRALEKLRKFFTKRGVISTTAIIAGAISANSVQAAPAALATGVTAVAVAKGAAASSSTLTLIQGALKLMAWTKIKTAIVAGVAVMLAAGTGIVTIKEIARHRNDKRQVKVGPMFVKADPQAGPMDASALAAKLPQIVITGSTGRPKILNITPDLQSMSTIDPNVLDHEPPRVSITPSKSPQTNGSGGLIPGSNGRIYGIAQSIETILRSAYGGFSAQIVLPTNLPEGQYDFIANLPEDSPQALQKEIERQFGLVGKRELREAEILALRLKKAGAPGLKPSVTQENAMSEGPGHYSCRNMSLSGLAAFLNGYFGAKVVDRTGLGGRFDIELNWKEPDPLSPNPNAMKQALLEQLGLELVPVREPVEMLVVEKVK